jgi:hypothetical protein
VPGGRGAGRKNAGVDSSHATAICRSRAGLARRVAAERVGGRGLETYPAGALSF